jgi:hypothetical protein
MLKFAIAGFAFSLFAASAQAQQGYEFEVYGTGISRPGAGELEIHTNFVPSGAQIVDDSEGRATHRALRSAIELSTGLTNWLEGSLYAVTYARNGAGLQYVGNRARLTAVVPRNWKLPLELGVAQEIGYARPGFAEHRWAYELTPILGKRMGPVTLTVNPALERGLDGAVKEWEFEPRAQVEYAFADEGAIGLEYYSVLGALDEFDAKSHQRHQLFMTGKSELPGGLEAGFGLGRGLTSNSDRWVINTRLEIKF